MLQLVSVVEAPIPEDLSAVHEQLWQTVLQFGNLSAVQERNRIARDLHDSLGQSLTALNIQLQTAVKLWQLDPTRAEQFLAEAYRLGSIAAGEVRQTVKTLRTEGSEDQSLETLIELLARDFERSTGVFPTTQIHVSDPLPVEFITPLYRIVQEALNNICKYAEATEVQIHLNTTPTTLSLMIQDNGRGFDLKQARTGFGLQGMRERVALLRGAFQLETALGAGCQICVEIPLKPVLKESEAVAQPQATVDVLEMISDVPEAVSSEIEAQPRRGLALSPAQLTRIEKLLLAFIGPIAPILLQEVSAQSQDYAEFVETLSRRIAVHSRNEFEQQMTLFADPSGREEKAPIVPLVAQTNQIVTEAKIRQCERELTAMIGPIAPLLIEQVLRSAPEISLVELVEILEAKISHPGKKAEFKRQILTH